MARTVFDERELRIRTQALSWTVEALSGQTHSPRETPVEMRHRRGHLPRRLSLKRVNRPSCFNEIRDALDKHDVEYLFIGTGAAIIHGFADTTQDADLYIRKTRTNGEALLQALETLGFDLQAQYKEDVKRGKDFIQLQDGPFDIDLIFAPDGIERFEDA